MYTAAEAFQQTTKAIEQRSKFDEKLVQEYFNEALMKIEKAAQLGEWTVDMFLTVWTMGACFNTPDFMETKRRLEELGFTVNYINKPGFLPVNKTVISWKKEK